MSNILFLCRRTDTDPIQTLTTRNRFEQFDSAAVLIYKCLHIYSNTVTLYFIITLIITDFVSYEAQKAT